MTDIRKKPTGRLRRYAEYEVLLASVSKQITKRPKYLKGIGLLHGKRGITAWLKIRMPHGGSYRGQIYAPGSYLEMKLGQLGSFDWEHLEDAYRAFQGKAERGEPLEENPDITFTDYADIWLSYAKGRIEENNLNNLKRDIDNRLKPFFGRKGLMMITAADVNLWQAQQRESVSISTIKRNKNTLSAILNRALKDSLIERNPCNHSDKLRVPDPEPRYIKPDECRQLLDNAGKVNQWLGDYLLWCLHSGMRQGEISRLKWSNVFIPDIGVPHLTFRTGKTQKTRNITCTKTMTSILKKLMPEKCSAEMNVFPYPKITIRRAWGKLRDITGLKDITLHNFRTSNATYAAVSGVDMRTLGSRLGHTDLEMLQKHYAGVQISAESQAAEKIEAALDTLLKTK